MIRSHEEPSHVVWHPAGTQSVGDDADAGARRSPRKRHGLGGRGQPRKRHGLGGRGQRGHC